MDFLEFEEWLFSKDCFENHDVSYIDSHHNQHYLEQSDFLFYQADLVRIITSENTIKVEQFEKKFISDHTTAHLFLNQKDGPSFDTHTDPVDVLIECLDGIKYIEIDGKEKVLHPKEHVLIPANTPHRALNYERALIISYGFNDTETLTRLRKDDRNL